MSRHLSSPANSPRHRVRALGILAAGALALAGAALPTALATPPAAGAATDGRADLRSVAPQRADSSGITRSASAQNRALDPSSTELVTVPGSHNAAMGCPGDWQPGCKGAALTLDKDSGLYQGTWKLPAGTYEYKVAIGGSWDVNYGAGGVQGGDNLTYTLAAEQQVTFYYDPVSHKFMNTAQGPIVTLPGSFNAAAGCSGDWMPACMRTWMGVPDAAGNYTWSTRAIPAGSHEVKVAHGLSWDESYGAGGAGGSNYTFATSANKRVEFTYNGNTHVLTIAVEDPPLPGTRQFLGHWISQTTIAWPADISPNAASTFELWADPDGGMALSGGSVTSQFGQAAVKLGTLTRGEPLSAEQLKNRAHLRGYRTLTLSGASRQEVEEALKGQVMVLQRDATGTPEVFTGLQVPGVLDELYATNAKGAKLGASFDNSGVPTVRLWAPTAKNVTLALGDTAVEMTRAADGTWSATGRPEWKNQTYTFEVKVYVPQEDAVVTSKVTDPYSVGLTRNSAASVLLDLTDPAWAPALWKDSKAPRLEKFVDRSIYELHIRDFSINDKTVPEELRGTYKAFAQEGSDGVKRLTELAKAGMNTIHLLPSFDIATIEEDRAKQVTPVIPQAGPASPEQQAAVVEARDKDGFNWGYDPFHYTTPEGSYASATAQDGGARTAEFREMVGGLHRMGFQVVLDQVFNHTAQSGQGKKSVLDRVVPGYYHRLNATGKVENSTCCENIATEHRMAEKLMVDSVVTWARDYRVDGFRFDLMGHHTVGNMKAIRAALDRLTEAGDGIDGTKVYLYGEGWNFGEVENNARFQQATQGQLSGTHIGAFNDRLRDAVHGGGPFDADKAKEQGFGTGLYTDPNETNAATPTPEMLANLRHRQDLIRLGLAGNLANFEFETAAGKVQKGSQLDYNGKPAGYASEPDESVNYVDAHDNETLFDVGAWKLPQATKMEERVRMNTLSLATVTYSQSPAFWHAGTDLLRSKSLDRNSYNSGDHFNRIDWTMQTNNFGVGLPPKADNGEKWDKMRPILEKIAPPTPAHIAAARAQALELLSVRTGQPLLRLGSAQLIKEKVSFPNAGAQQTAGLIVMLVDDTRGADYDPQAEKLLVVFNASPKPITEVIAGQVGVKYTLAPQLRDNVNDDPVLAGAIWKPETGEITVPARSAVVMVAPQAEGTVLTKVTAPQFTDLAGTASDTYTIPTQAGVEYLVAGALRAAGTYPGAGQVTVTARAQEGYSFAPGLTTQFTHTFKSEPCRTFVDLGNGRAFAKEITWLACAGITTGWDDTSGAHSFRPYGKVLRDQMAAFLFRLAATKDTAVTSYQAPAAPPFIDVRPTHPFYREIAWLKEAQISTGWINADGSRSYQPYAPVLRDQLAAFLHRYAARTDTAAGAYQPPALSLFSDVPPTHPLYREIAWLKETGISTGWQLEGGTYRFGPYNPVLRDQVAAFLYRLTH